MSILARIYGTLASPRLLVGLALLWILVYVTVAVWLDEAFAAFVVALGNNPIVQLFYFAFVASLGANLLRMAGNHRSEGALMLLCWAVFPAGLWLYGLGFGLSTVLGLQHWSVVQEGELLELPWQIRPWTMAELRPPFDSEYVEETSSSLLFGHEPIALFRSGSEEAEVGAFPPSRLGDSDCNLMDFGLAPELRLTREGRTLYEGSIEGRLLPPGVSEEFDLATTGYHVRIRLVPNAHRELAGGTSRVFRMDSPRYHLVVRFGNEILFDGEAATEVQLSDGARLALEGPGYWAWVRCGRDPGRPLLMLGLGLMILGLPLATTRLIRLLSFSRARSRDHL